jgi:hypothetical protein
MKRLVILLILFFSGLTSCSKSEQSGRTVSIQGFSLGFLDSGSLKRVWISQKSTRSIWISDPGYFGKVFPEADRVWIQNKDIGDVLISFSGNTPTLHNACMVMNPPKALLRENINSGRLCGIVPTQTAPNSKTLLLNPYPAFHLVPPP